LNAIDFGRTLMLAAQGREAAAAVNRHSGMLVTLCGATNRRLIVD
jgi:hypothetical protein